MKRTVLTYFSTLFVLLFSSAISYGQTTVTASTTAATNVSGGSNVFGVTNNNAFGIAITTFSAFHNTANNGRSYSVWYHPTALTGAPSITTANGWVLVGTSPLITGATTNQIIPVLTNRYVVIPPSTTYRIAIVCNSGLAFFSTTGTNTYTSGNVTIQTGSSAISPGYAGPFPSPNLTPRYFSGAVTFVQAPPNNISAFTLVSPVNNTSYCANDSVLVRVVLKNDAGTSASNFPVTARYIGSTTNTITNTYTGTLAAYARDTFTVGKLNLPQGTYTVRAYTQLSGDTISQNDTTPVVSITFRRPNTLPVVVSDTVCPGDTAIVSIRSVINNTNYQWYSDPTGGTSIATDTMLIFETLMQDSVLWVASDSANCQSNRVQVTAKVNPPPAPYLGDDTSFCESIPLILDGGHPGATYMWSTGDSTQTIPVTNVSGNYWVRVTQYCTRADTINVTIRPLPTVSGISYVRMNNTYQFYPSSYQNVEDFEWHFGDGATSTDTTPIHTYTQSVNVALIVKLIVKNTCSSDTAYRSVPTSVNDIEGEENVRVYPNPAKDRLFIELKNARLEEMYLVNMMGSIVRKENGSSGLNSIDLNLLPPGNYILKLKTTEGDFARTVQISR
ncbi:MAG TPA: T9SS type A sorting domain-containing protein [Flavipsychrobacter sp.]|nr:T9SS type A sorting domain-containing protein [Flavipsychrobacter sp.]